MESEIIRIVAQFGFPALMCCAMGWYVKSRTDAEDAERRALAARIETLEDRQFDVLLKLVSDDMESRKRQSAALSALAHAIEQAPCGTATLEQALSGTITPQ